MPISSIKLTSLEEQSLKIQDLYKNFLTAIDCLELNKASAIFKDLYDNLQKLIDNHDRILILTEKDNFKFFARGMLLSQGDQTFGLGPLSKEAALKIALTQLVKIAFKVAIQDELLDDLQFTWRNCPPELSALNTSISTYNYLSQFRKKAKLIKDQSVRLKLFFENPQLCTSFFDLVKRGFKVEFDPSPQLIQTKSADQDFIEILKKELNISKEVVNNQDDDGNTALHYLTKITRYNYANLLFQLFITAGADPKIKNKTGGSAVEYILKLHTDYQRTVHILKLALNSAITVDNPVCIEEGELNFNAIYFGADSVTNTLIRVHSAGRAFSNSQINQAIKTVERQLEHVEKLLELVCDASPAKDLPEHFSSLRFTPQEKLPPYLEPEDRSGFLHSPRNSNGHRKDMQ